MMHAGIGTALGGVMTMVGEPQNLIIAKYVGWNFSAFFTYDPSNITGIFMWLNYLLLRRTF